MPNSTSPPNALDVDVAKKVLIEAGRQFCYLVKEEKQALSLSPFFQGSNFNFPLYSKIKLILFFFF